MVYHINATLNNINTFNNTLKKLQIPWFLCIGITTLSYEKRNA